MKVLTKVGKEEAPPLIWGHSKDADRLRRTTYNGRAVEDISY